MLTCYAFMFFNTINIFLTALLGLFDITIFGTTHMRFSMFMILIFLITEILVMYFFITTGKGIKQAIQDGLGDKGLWNREKKLKMRLFPHLMLTILLFSIWFILWGAVDSNHQFAILHQPLFYLALVHYAWTLVIKNRSFQEQINIISNI
tara:strand:+ start:20949 stop:21398 length:450 start_codon:yes stop_codon:yes gene_type:complete